MRYIDTHCHIGRLYVGNDGLLTEEAVLSAMDRAGIERAALLPIESPEEAHFYVTTEEVLGVCRRHPDRFIPFCNVDPRIASGDNSAILRERLRQYREQGCRGYGEAMSGLAVDDIRLQRVYAICGEFGMPVVYHMDAERNLDAPGFPGLERMLRQFPSTVFVGHGQRFWAEISGDADSSQYGGYPSGPVTPGGAIVRLLETCSNLYADLSARSALNALTRGPDPAFASRFLERFQQKLFFGSDLCSASQAAQPLPIMELLQRERAAGRLSETAFRRIARENALRVFALSETHCCPRP
ncbi:MAG: amidohydrolase family protein [Planctomycetota bacterium]|nr:amidohydrolase family protein [Planctomycetota bacterium]